MPENHMWIVALVLSTSIAFYILYQFFKNKDKRKLMFSIAIFLSNLFFIGVILGNIVPNADVENTLWINITLFSSIPLMLAVFIAVNEDFFNIKNFDIVFYSFLVFTVIIVALFFLPYTTQLPSILIHQIIGFEVLIVSFYLYYKTRNIINLYFFFFVVCSITAGFSFDIDALLASFSFVMGYIFLALAFVEPHIKTDKKSSLSSYFSVEQKLKTFEEKYKQLFNSIPDAITLLADDGTILDLNHSMANNFGRSREEMIGKNMQDFLPEDVSSSRFEIGLKAFRTWEVQENEDKRGDFYFHNMYIPVKTEDNKKNLMVIARNITNEKKMEIEKEKKLQELKDTELATLNIMEDMQETVENLENARKEIIEKNEELRMTNTELNVAREQLTDLNENLEQKVKERTKEVRKLIKQKDDFINQLGHDLKTPLTPLNTLLPIVRDSIDDEKSKELLDVSIQNVKYMKNLVIKTLKLARLNSPETDLEKEEINLLDETRKVLNNRIFDFEKNQIKIINNIDEDIFMNVDPVRLKELLDNLISNAVKYNKKGGEIKIDAISDIDEVKIRIQDTGQGMTTEQAEKIFDEFYKADESRHDFESSGLGLSICKRIVEKHGGRIWAESPGPGKGTTFYLSFKNEIKEKTIK